MTAPYKRSTEELMVMADLLDSAADEFAERSCTDFVTEATPQNKAVAAAAIEYFAKTEEWGDEDAEWEDYVADVLEAQLEVHFFIDWMSRYLAQRCKQVALDKSSAALSRAELMLVGEMLNIAADDCVDQGNNDAHFLPASGQNKLLLAAVVKHHGAANWKEHVKTILDANGIIGAPERWILAYLTKRCQVPA